MGALAERSRAPHRPPHRTAPEIETLVLAARRQYGWGAKKLLQVLRTRQPDRVWPARSTLNAVLERHGLLRKHRRQRRWFKTGDGQYCYPLTVTDHFSRALLGCRGLPSVRSALATPVFRALFREVGLPDAIRTDNGAPFAANGIAFSRRVRRRTGSTNGCIVN